MTASTDVSLGVAVEQLVTALVRTPHLPGDAEPSDLTVFQAIVLATLVDEGPHRLRSLASSLGTTDATASRNVDALEVRALAIRRADISDGRGIIVSATEEGIAAVRERRARLDRLVAGLVDELGPVDGAHLSNLLAQLRELFDGSGSSTPPRR